MIESPNDYLMQEDLEYVINSNIDFKVLKNSTILVTGATGLIGSQIIKTLACANRILFTNIKIVALARNENKAKEVFGELLTDVNVRIIYQDIRDSLEFDEKVDYIIHGASITSSKSFVDLPVDTIEIALNGTRNILELAKEKRVKGFIYLSSLEVYGVPANKDKSICEEDYGYIDPLNPRSSYSEGKRMAECMCVAYNKQYNLPIKIARLTQTFGAGVEYSDSRVFAEFARCVIEKRDIILHTKGDTIRNYCYTRDAILAILLILCQGKEGEAYNVANMDSEISILEMAKLVAEEVASGRISVKFDIPNDISSLGYNPVAKTVLDSSKLYGLGWKPSVGLVEMYRRMIKSMLQK